MSSKIWKKKFPPSSLSKINQQSTTNNFADEPIKDSVKRRIEPERAICAVCDAPCFKLKNRKLPINTFMCKRCRKAYFYQMDRKKRGFSINRCPRGGYCEVGRYAPHHCSPCRLMAFQRVIDKDYAAEEGEGHAVSQPSWGKLKISLSKQFCVKRQKDKDYKPSTSINQEGISKQFCKKKQKDKDYKPPTSIKLEGIDLKEIIKTMSKMSRKKYKRLVEEAKQRQAVVKVKRIEDADLEKYEVSFNISKSPKRVKRVEDADLQKHDVSFDISKSPKRLTKPESPSSGGPKVSAEKSPSLNEMPPGLKSMVQSCLENVATKPTGFNGYQLFCNTFKSAITETNNEHDAGRIMGKINILWKSLTEKQKNIWKRTAATRLRRINKGWKPLTSGPACQSLAKAMPLLSPGMEKLIESWEGRDEGKSLFVGKNLFKDDVQSTNQTNNPSFEIEIDRPEDADEGPSSIDRALEENKDSGHNYPTEKADYNQTCTTNDDQSMEISNSQNQETSSFSPNNVNTISSPSNDVLQDYCEENEHFVDSDVQSYNQKDTFDSPIGQTSTQTSQQQFVNEEQIPFLFGTSNNTVLPSYSQTSNLSESTISQNEVLSVSSNVSLATSDCELTSNFGKVHSATITDTNTTKNVINNSGQTNLIESIDLQKQFKKDQRNLKKRKFRQKASKVVKVYVFTCGHACSQCNSGDAMDWLKESGIHTAEPQDSGNIDSDLPVRSTPYIIRPSLYNLEHPSNASRGVSKESSSQYDQRQFSNKAQTSTKNVWRTICLPKPITVSLHDPDEEEVEQFNKKVELPYSKKNIVKSSLLKGTELSNFEMDKHLQTSESLSQFGQIGNKKVVNLEKSQVPQVTQSWCSQAADISHIVKDSILSSKYQATDIMGNFTGDLRNPQNLISDQTSQLQNLPLGSEADVGSYVVPVLNNSGNLLLMPAAIEMNQIESVAPIDDPSNSTFVVNMPEGSFSSPADKISDISKASTTVSSLLETLYAPKVSLYGKQKTRKKNGKPRFQKILKKVSTTTEKYNHNEREIVPVGLFSSKSLQNQFPQAHILDDLRLPQSSFSQDDTAVAPDATGVSQSTMSRLRKVALQGAPMLANSDGTNCDTSPKIVSPPSSPSKLNPATTIVTSTSVTSNNPTLLATLNKPIKH